MTEGFAVFRRRNRNRFRYRRRSAKGIAPRWKMLGCILAVAVLLGGNGYLERDGQSKAFSDRIFRVVLGAAEEGYLTDFGEGEPPEKSRENSGEEEPAERPGENSGEGEPPEKSRENSGEEEPAEKSGEVSGEDPGVEAGVVSEEPIQTSMPEPEVTVVMVGDILLHTRVAESGELPEGGYEFSQIFAQVREEIAAADLALVNQEVILGGAELGVSGYPAFNAPFELGEALEDAGFDVVLHATNHALDKGKKGIRNCLAFWEGHPDMAVLGIHGSEAEQQEIYVCELEGIRIAILNYTYGTNGIALPKDMPYAVDMLEKARVAADLKKAQELADFIIVCPHWGTEYNLEAAAEQKSWAKLFAENGADLVLGTHPHVLEPVEWVSAATDAGDGESAISQDTLVYYSLGNFVNWTSGTGAGVANRMVGGMAQVTIGWNEFGEAVIKDYTVEPLVCHVEQGFGGVTVYPLEAYTEELAAANEIIAQDGSFSLEYCRKLVEQVLGDF